MVACSSSTWGAASDRKADNSSHDEVHAERCRRLAALQSQQLARGPKILNLIRGQLQGRRTVD
jgi:hypothetical protein